MSVSVCACAVASSSIATHTCTCVFARYQIQYTRWLCGNRRLCWWVIEIIHWFATPCDDGAHVCIHSGNERALEEQIQNMLLSLPLFACTIRTQHLSLFSVGSGRTFILRVRANLPSVVAECRRIKIAVQKQSTQCESFKVQLDLENKDNHQHSMFFNCFVLLVNWSEQIVSY